MTIGFQLLRCSLVLTRSNAFWFRLVLRHIHWEIGSTHENSVRYFENINVVNASLFLNNIVIGSMASGHRSCSKFKIGSIVWPLIHSPFEFLSLTATRKVSGSLIE